MGKSFSMFLIFLVDILIVETKKISKTANKFKSYYSRNFMRATHYTGNGNVLYVFLLYLYGGLARLRMKTPKTITFLRLVSKRLQKPQDPKQPTLAVTVGENQLNTELSGWAFLIG